MPIIDLDDVRQQRAEQAAAAPAVVHSECDPACPNRCHHIIVAETKDAVQSAILGIYAEVEQTNGYAHFTNPRRFGNFYYAEGEAMVFPILE